MSRCHHGWSIKDNWMECPHCLAEHDARRAADALEDIARSHSTTRYNHESTYYESAEELKKRIETLSRELDEADRARREAEAERDDAEIERMKAENARDDALRRIEVLERMERKRTEGEPYCPRCKKFMSLHQFTNFSDQSLFYKGICPKCTTPMEKRINI